MIKMPISRRSPSRRPSPCPHKRPSRPPRRLPRLRLRMAKRHVYQAAFFAQYAPRSALDIAKRVPGFTLDLGSTQTTRKVDVRGFAGTAGMS